MRFLKDVKFELDEKAEAVLAIRLENFMRCGSFTLSEWESLTPREQELAVGVRRALQLEAALMQRRALTADSLDDAVHMLQEAGDQQSAAKLLLDDATRKLAAPEVRL